MDFMHVLTLFPRIRSGTGKGKETNIIGLHTRIMEKMFGTQRSLSHRTKVYVLGATDNYITAAFIVVVFTLDWAIPLNTLTKTCMYIPVNIMVKFVRFSPSQMFS